MIFDPKSLSFFLYTGFCLYCRVMRIVLFPLSMGLFDYSVINHFGQQLKQL